MRKSKTDIMSNHRDHTPSSGSKEPAKADEKWIEELVKCVHSLRNGTVQIKVHDSQVVLIERIEQVRFDLNSKPAAPAAVPITKPAQKQNL